MTQGKGFGGFGLGKMKELADAFKKAQQVQEDAKKLQEELEKQGIDSNISTGSICVHTNSEKLLSKFPELGNRVLEKNEKPLSQSVREAFKAEKK